MNDSWQERDVQLPLLLGELRLGALHLRGLVVNHGLHPRLDLEVPELPPSAEVAVIRSHPLSSVFPEYAGPTPAFRYVPDRYHRCYVNLQQTLADYLKKFTSKSRYTLLKKVRRFHAASGGRIVMQEFTRPDEMDRFLSLARQISAKTYQERLLHAGIPDGPTFVEEMLTLAARGAVRAYTLFLHDHPVAYMYCAAMEAGDLMYRFVGHDPDYGRLSPGVVLQYLALERLFAEQRFAFLDFAEGTGMHKVFFSTGSLACADVYYFRDTLRYRTLVGLHAALRYTSRTASAFSEVLGIKRELKRFLREGTAAIVPSGKKRTGFLPQHADAELAGEHLETSLRSKTG